jgi:hydrogenase maturation protein HypF
MLACGADMKGAFALAKNDRAFIEDGFGDLSDPGNLARYETAVDRLCRRLSIRPEVIVCDHHPGYLSTRFAQRYGLSNLVKQLCDVQHHEAHIASAMTDNRIAGDVIGFAFDGTGLGWDGRIWGGEIFVGRARRFVRAGHFEYMPIAGGDAAVREPWRMAAAYLERAYGSFKGLRIPFVRRLDAAKWRIMKKMILEGFNCPLTSSAGRLFDAAASIILCRMRSEKEAALPMALEKIAVNGRFDCYRFETEATDGRITIGWSGAIKGIVGDISRGVSRGIISAKFHNTVAAAIVDAAARIRKRRGTDRVVLSGGVFQNRYLTSRAVGMLEKKGFKVYTHSKVSANDSGIPLGQIAIARS